jgi:nonsense-mediated mRNA decay protein 3
VIALERLKCIVCGKGAQVLDSLCEKCICQRRRFIELPLFMEHTVCAHCGSTFIGKRWKDATNIEEELVASVKRAAKLDCPEGCNISTDVTLKTVDDFNVDARAEAKISVGKMSFTQSGKTRVRIRRAVCERCSRVRGKYFEATLQVRGAGRALTEREHDLVYRKVQEKAMGAGDRDSYITKEEERDGGLDFQLGKISVAKGLSRFLADATGGRIIETKTLAGRKEGKELFRVTFLVRIPNLQSGDFATLDKRMLLVTHVGPGGVSAMDLATGKPEVLDEKDEGRARRIGSGELVEVAVVLEARKPDLQIMDPVTYSTIPLVAPEWFWNAHKKKAPENVRILKSGDDVYLVPPD